MTDRELMQQALEAKEMLYFEHDQDHYLLWPVLAFGWMDDGEFWIGVGWLNFEFGWRSGDSGGWGNEKGAGV